MFSLLFFGFPAEKVTAKGAHFPTWLTAQQGKWQDGQILAPGAPTTSLAILVGGFYLAY